MEYLETDADPYEFQKYLSLCGPSIETVEKIGEDFVFDIEVTSNRVDMASVYGIAQEAQAILPQFGKKAILKNNVLKKYSFDNLRAEPTSTHALKVKIEDQSLVSRFTAVVYDSIQIKQSPEYISRRLALCGVKVINNVVDISNYLMLSLGQPVHMFDFDQIIDSVMIVRTSIKGEKLITLDDKEIVLPGGDIVIEDGSGRLIDLCGIMGGKNSSITNETTRVVFFVQTYDKKHIRQTSMATGQRTLASAYFEKDLDTERVEPTFVYGHELLQNLANGIVRSELLDLYFHKRKEKHIKTYLKDIHRVVGIPIDEEKVTSILIHLGFQVNRHENNELAYPDGVSFDIAVPTYRTDDVSIQEDIIEEVARVYGYHNLPNNISPLIHIKQPKYIQQLFTVQYKTKYFLKHIGLHEFLNYSMVSADLLVKLDYNISKHLKISNSISSEIEYMRTSLLPSLLQNMKQNIGKKEVLKFFEIAKIYHKTQNNLPKEIYKLAIAVNTDIMDLKGIVTALFLELNMQDLSLKNTNHHLSSTSESIISKGNIIGFFGALHQKYNDILGINQPIYLAEIDFEPLLTQYSPIHPYHIPSPYAMVKLDLTFEKTYLYQEIQTMSLQASKLIHHMEYLSSFDNKITIRYFFNSPDRNITEEEAKIELEKVSHILNKPNKSN